MDKRKAIIMGVIAAVVLLMIGVNWISRLRAQRRIDQVTAELQALEGQRDSIMRIVDENNAIRLGLSDSVEALEQQTVALREAVDRAEQGRRAAQREIRTLDTSDEIPDRFRETFPAFAPSMRVYDEREVDPDGFEYLMVPLGFAESFIIHKQNSDSLARQRDRLLALDSLQLEANSMQDSIITLLDINQDALQVGFDSATALAERRTEELIAELNKPRFSLNLPTAAALGVAAAVGLVVGTQIR